MNARRRFGEEAEGALTPNPSSSSKPASESHLSDEQIADLLAGELPAESLKLHLGACAPCRVQVDGVRQALEDFNALSLGWAEREAARRVRVPSRWALRLGARPAWGTGLAAAAVALGLAIGFEMPRHTQTPVMTGSAVKVAAVAPTGAELARDNHLLASIDAELNAAAQPPIPVAELKRGSAPAHGEVLAN